MRETVAYTKVLDLGQHLVVEGKVIAGDDVDAGVLLDLPVGQPKALGLGEEVGLGDLASPVLGVVSTIGSRVESAGRGLQASVAFLRSRLTPMRGNPRTADWTMMATLSDQLRWLPIESACGKG